MRLSCFSAIAACMRHPPCDGLTISESCARHQSMVAICDGPHPLDFLMVRRKLSRPELTSALQRKYVLQAVGNVIDRQNCREAAQHASMVMFEFDEGFSAKPREPAIVSRIG